MIYTVKGPIEKKDLGITLSHEHFKWETDDNYANQLYFDKVYDNGKIDKNMEILLPLIKDLYNSSCRAVVETTSPIGGQDVKLLRRLSQESRMHIIPCTGWNLPRYLYNVFPEKYAEQLANRWIRDFELGLDTLDGMIIRPGHIKIFIWEGPLLNVDRETVRAAVMASRKTGMPIHCHIMEAEALYQVVKILEEESADFSKFLWAHAGHEGDFDAIDYAIGKGIWIGFDIIKGDSYEKYCNLIIEAIKRGYKSKLLLSQDYDFYEEATEHGKNHPCADFFTRFIPYCVERGLSNDDIESILTDNPANFLDF